MISRPEALALGLTAAQIRVRVGTSGWEVDHRGVYHLAGSPRDDFSALRGAVLLGGRTAAVSHGSAAWLWGLSAGPGEPTYHCAAQPGRPGGRRPGGAVALGRRKWCCGTACRVPLPSAPWSTARPYQRPRSWTPSSIPPWPVGWSTSTHWPRSPPIDACSTTRAGDRSPRGWRPGALLGSPHPERAREPGGPPLPAASLAPAGGRGGLGPEPPLPARLRLPAACAWPSRSTVGPPISPPSSSATTTAAPTP